jgi:arylsulfatase A-like enzyme
VHRRDFLKGAAATVGGLALGGCGALEPGMSKRLAGPPNFVFIFIDDLGWRDVGFMGSKYYRTPNIDKLASEGMVFTDAYANAPNCAPSRACLLSGQYSPRHGVYTVGDSDRGDTRLRKLIPIENNETLASEKITVAEALKPAGYVSAAIGKWHCGGAKDKADPLSQGFDVAVEREEYSHWTRKGEYLTDKLTDAAVEFIEDNAERPFFLYLAHYAVHTPIQAKKEMIEKYTRLTGDEYHNNAKYAAMIESVDESVGRVMGKSDELGLSENTVVLFFSDNGGYGPVTSMHPLRGDKGMLYEGGIREPATVRWPGVTKAGSQCSEPIIGIDFYPTMLEMAGVKRPEGYALDGVSIVPLLRGEESLNREAIFWHFPGYLQRYSSTPAHWRTTPAGAVRAGDYKLIEFFEDGRLELYNLADDIGEETNLADAMPEKAAELHELLRQWRNKLDAPVPTELNPEYDPTYNPPFEVKKL